MFIRRFPKNEQPWLARVKNGEVTDSISLKDMGIASSDGLDCASDPNVMEGVMRYAFTHYPAMEGNYGLVLWGHGSGWLIEDEKMPMASRAFGVDKGNNRQALQAVKATHGEGYVDMQGLIHYYHTDTSRDFYPEYNIFYDAGDYFRAHAPKDAYQQWRQVLDQTIVECRMAKNWNTDKLWYRKYADFEVTAEKFHGVSMFVPQDPNTGDYAKYNEDIQQMAWYYAVEQ